ncbi:hypothetical protein ACPA9J_30245 [Pseudomonas aeruginosa]
MIELHLLDCSAGQWGLQDHSGESRPVLLRLSAGVPGPGSR